MNIKENIKEFSTLLEGGKCKLVAVSKTKPVDMIMEAYEAGQRHFGENKVQELTEKYEKCPKDIHWHMIGHLQTNKVKYIAPFVHLIHGVDSVKLLNEINKQAAKCGRVIDCLLQIHIAEEETKFGLPGDAEQLLQLITNEQLVALANVRIVGLMGMATFTDDTHQVRSEFKTLASLFNSLKSQTLPANFQLTEISMGMSDDYHIAMEEGSTLIRVGSKLFGDRYYPN